jgi:hypothetical protein
MCLLDWCGSIVTYDIHAFRLWDLKSQLKAIHHDKRDQDLQFMKMETFSILRVIVAFFSIKSNEETIKGGKIRIMSDFLTILQEIQLQFPRYQTIHIAEDQSSILIIDQQQVAHILNLETATIETITKSSQFLKPLVELHYIQQMDCSDLHMRVSCYYQIDLFSSFIIHYLIYPIYGIFIMLMIIIIGLCLCRYQNNLYFN